MINATFVNRYFDNSDEFQRRPYFKIRAVATTKPPEQAIRLILDQGLNIAECHFSDRKFLRRKAFEKLKNRINSRDRKRANHRSAANEQPSRCHCRNRSGPQSAKESLAGALGFCPERERIVLGSFHVGPYGFRVDDPDQQRCHVVGDQDVRGTVYPRQSLFRHRGAVVALVSFMFVLHGLLAMRKFPANFQEYKSFASHRQMLRHEDTTLWWVQAWTGFALFFLASVHLYQMLMHPGDIGPYESAERVWSGRWWPLYLVLLFAVELHGGVGLYRLAVKWGWFEGEDPNRTRVMLKRLKWGITIFFLTLGLLTLAAYMKLGHERRDRLGERYVPSYARRSAHRGKIKV